MNIWTRQRLPRETKALHGVEHLTYDGKFVEVDKMVSEPMGGYGEL